VEDEDVEEKSKEAADGGLARVEEGHVRVMNMTPAGVELYLFKPGQAAYSPAVPLTYLAPQTHADLPVGGQPAKLAIRRCEDARMFFLYPGSTLTLAREETTASSIADGGAKSHDSGCHHYVLHDTECLVRRDGLYLAPRDLNAEVYPGPLFWNLPRNMQDAELEVGSVLRARGGSVSLKVVRDQGVDWRSYPTARVRVLKGGIHNGKMYSSGDMYLAKNVKSPRVVRETAAAHARVGGYFGSANQICRYEGSFEAQSGARLLIFEDFGERMSMFLTSGEIASPEDADRCAADLMGAVSSMHRAGLHHLAICPQNVWLCRDGMGRLRLKLGNLGIAEQPSEPLPGGRVPAVLRSFVAPELASSARLEAMAKIAAGSRNDDLEAASTSGGQSKLLGALDALPLLPTLAQAARRGNAAAASAKSETESGFEGRISELLCELPAFTGLSFQDLDRLSRRFEGPFRIQPGRAIFRQGDVGDYLYLVLAGEVVTVRGGRELCRYRRGDFFGEAALLGNKPSKRIFSASVRRGAPPCAVLCVGHAKFKKDLEKMGPLSELTAPSRWRYLAEAKVPLAQPKAADAFAVAATWCELVAGGRRGPLDRVRRADSIEKLRIAVGKSDLGGFYFTLEERRVAALITLVIRRATLQEALQCLESKDKGKIEGEEEEGHDDDDDSRVTFGGMSKAWADRWTEFTRNTDITRISPAGEVAADAIQMSGQVPKGLVEQFGKFQNTMTNRVGNIGGEFLGDLYGGLFAKDFFWMMRAATRMQKFPVRLVREADSGNVFAQWQVAALSTWERELRRQTWPRVGPSIRPALQSGFEIGAAIAKNRAYNFKLLWVDAFLGSFVKQLRAKIRIVLQRMRGSGVRWEMINFMLQDAVAKSRAAKRLVLLNSGRLPTALDQNAPKVLELLPSNWVPDIGLPLASGVGRGFFKRLRGGFRRGRRTRYTRPKFETWDVEDVPQFIIDFAREQGEQQAGLVAASVGDTVARDLGWYMGSAAGTAWGLLLAFSGNRPATTEFRVAGGLLLDDEEMLELAEYMQDED